MPDRGTLKAHPELCASLKRLASIYRFSVVEFTNVLLEYVVRDPDRIDAALDEARKESSRKARQPQGIEATALKPVAPRSSSAGAESN